MNGVTAVYLDNAATSFPKPEQVYRAVDRFMRENGASAGRGQYARAVAAEEVVFETRKRLAALFGVDEPSRVILTSGATEAINLALRGLLKPGDHVVTSSMEHNAVWRCLKALEAEGVAEVTAVPCLPDGTLPVERVKRALRPATRLVALLQASNVTGTLLPVAEIGELTRARGIPFLVDAAQTAGVFPIDVARLGIDLLAFPGHKGLLGPPGTGGLYVGPAVSPRPLKWGGTGRESSLENMPSALPDRYEAGTLNVPGIAGLGAGVGYVLARGVNGIRQHERALTGHALEVLARVPGLTVYGPADPDRQVGVISFNVEGLGPEQVAYALDEAYGIMVRAGLHCAPRAHRTIGTAERGTVRASVGVFNREADLDYLGRALAEIAALK